MSQDRRRIATRLTGATLDIVHGRGFGELLMAKFPWVTLAILATFFPASGLNLAPLGDLAADMKTSIVSVGLGAFIVSFGIALGAQIRRSDSRLRVLIVFAALLCLAVLELTVPLGAWLGASVLQAKPIFSFPLLDFIPNWLIFHYETRFTSPDSFAKIVSSRSSFFEDVKNIPGLVAATLNALINIIPDALMYYTARNTQMPLLWCLNFALSTFYWLAVSVSFMVFGYRWAAVFDRSTDKTIAYLDKLDGPRPRYALLCNPNSSQRPSADTETAAAIQSLFGSISSVARDNMLLHSAELFGGFCEPPHDIELFVTNGTDAGARAAARAAIQHGHCIAFGAISDQEAHGASEVLGTAGVPLITFAVGGAIANSPAFSLGWSVLDAFRVAVTFAVRSGVTHFICFLPDHYGQFSDAIVAVIRSAGGIVLGKEQYGRDAHANLAALVRITSHLTRPMGLVMPDPRFAARTLEVLQKNGSNLSALTLVGVGHWRYWQDDPDDSEEDDVQKLQNALYATPIGYRHSIKTGNPELAPIALFGAEIVGLAKTLDLMRPRSAMELNQILDGWTGQIHDDAENGTIVLRKGGRALRQFGVFRIVGDARRMVWKSEPV